MNYKIVTQDPFDFISLDEAKVQCRLMPSFTLDDGEISSLIISASDIAQQYLNRLVTPGNVLHYIQWYCSEFMVFGGNVTAINEVKASLSGTEVVIPDTEYSLNPVTGNITVSTSYASYTEWYFDIDCGYTDLNRPEGIKHGILKLIATLYNHHEDFAVGQSVEKMPSSSKAILGMYRRYVS